MDKEKKLERMVLTYNGVQDENRKVKNTYEPKNLRFLPVDTVELGISEVDGTQTSFLDHMGETIVTLCFRRQNVDNLDDIITQ